MAHRSPNSIPVDANIGHKLDERRAEQGFLVRVGDDLIESWPRHILEDIGRLGTSGHENGSREESAHSTNGHVPRVIGSITVAETQGQHGLINPN